jgi:hypothetical protein
MQLIFRDAAVLQQFSYRQRGYYMTASSSTRYDGKESGARDGQGVLLVRIAHFILRATFINSPAADIHTSNELPPYEMSGSVKPVTGIEPVTPPMLMIA